MRQKTILRTATIRGIGLQTGRPVKMKLIPAGPDSGITFVRTDLRGAPAIKACVANLKEPGRGILQRTILCVRRAEVQTVEHLMAALSGLCVDNITVEMDNVEAAGLDGSAKEFVEVIQHAGLEEQDAPRRYIEIEKPLICQAKGASIQVLPDEKSRVEYFMDYDHPLLREQWADITLGGSDGEIAHFAGEAAPARTFHVDSVKRPFALRFLAGLGKGANYDVTLVIRKDGPVNNRFRFPDEPARHKLLDLIGDLYMLGRHIKGRVIARKSGHALNSCFLKKIQDELEAQERKKERSGDRRRINTENIASPISVSAGR